MDKTEITIYDAIDTIEAELYTDLHAEIETGDRNGERFIEMLIERLSDFHYMYYMYDTNNQYRTLSR